MSDRRQDRVFIVAALLLFGLVYEAGHLRHHLEHAHHREDADHGTHRECLTFHAGAVVESSITAPAIAEHLAPAAAPAAPHPVRDGLRLLPESRAPPSSC